MRFEDTEISKSIYYQKVVLNFCTFYAADKFVIVEFDEGIHIDIPMHLEFKKAVRHFYKKNKKFGYISNRVNTYSFDPLLWRHFKGEGNDPFVTAAAVVIYRSSAVPTTKLESKLTHLKFNSTFTIEEAIGWICNVIDEKISV